MPLENMRDLLKGSLGRTLEGLSVEDRLSLAWPVACGRALAEHGTVAGFAEGLLQVRVNDPAWRQQFFAMQGQIAAELSRVAGVRVTAIHWGSKGTDRR